MGHHDERCSSEQNMQVSVDLVMATFDLTDDVSFTGLVVFSVARYFRLVPSRREINTSRPSSNSLKKKILLAMVLKQESSGFH